MTELKRANILLVDDDAQNLFAMESVLEDLGYDLYKATSGHEALRLVVKQMFNLVILDVKMPDMNGIEVAQLMRGRAESQNIPIIFVTGISRQEKYEFKGADIGEIDYLFKPVDPDILKSKVQEFLEISRQRGVIDSQATTLRRKVLELEREIARRKLIEKELIEAKDAAEAATIAKSQFLAVTSHELRTPLNSILGFSEMLQEEIYGPLNERQLNAIKNVTASGYHLLDLISDILDVSRLESGSLEIELNDIDVESLCQKCLTDLREAAYNKKLRVSFQRDSDVSFITADFRRMKQILNKLLGNAVKFTPEQGVVGLEVSGDRARHVAQFIVRDSGIGISEEQLACLFKPFSQADSRLSREYEGLGLGLALVKRLVELHQGTVTVKTRQGDGSEFTVTLPWIPDKAPVAKEKDHPDSEPSTAPQNNA